MFYVQHTNNGYIYWLVLKGERERERDHDKDINLIQIWFAIISARHKIEGHVYLELLNFSLSQSKSVCHIFHKFSKVKNLAAPKSAMRTFMQ